MDAFGWEPYHPERYQTTASGIVMKIRATVNIDGFKKGVEYDLEDGFALGMIARNHAERVAVALFSEREKAIPKLNHETR